MSFVGDGADRSGDLPLGLLALCRRRRPRRGRFIRSFQAPSSSGRQLSDSGLPALHRKECRRDGPVLPARVDEITQQIATMIVAVRNWAEVCFIALRSRAGATGADCMTRHLRYRIHGCDASRYLPATSRVRLSALPVLHDLGRFPSHAALRLSWLRCNRGRSGGGIVWLAVFLIGVTKSGFGSGVGLMIVPMMAIAMGHIPGRGSEAALGLLLPLLIIGDLIAVWQVPAALQYGTS